MTPEPRAHTFIVLLEDLPGALNRVVSLFRRRVVNIDSLTVGRTEKPGVSRITLVVRADANAARLLEANLYKLVDVLDVQDVTAEPVVVRELAFVKLGAQFRTEVMQLCDVFRARVVDMGPSSITVESTGSQDKIDGLIEALKPFGIVELVRTGAVAIARGVSLEGTCGAPADGLGPSAGPPPSPALAGGPPPAAVDVLPLK